jgi:hypothetical protein
VLDKVKIIKLSDYNFFPIPPQTEISSRTLFGPTRESPHFFTESPSQTLSGSPRTLSGIWIWAQRLNFWESSIYTHIPPTAFYSWPLHSPVEKAQSLHSKRSKSLFPRAFILVEWSKDSSSLCDSPLQARLDCWIFILCAYYSWSFAPRWLEVALELPLGVVSLGKFVLPIFVIVSSSRVSWWLFERVKVWERSGSLWTPQRERRILCESEPRD